jgi:hypothetical protein
MGQVDQVGQVGWVVSLTKVPRSRFFNYFPKFAVSLLPMKYRSIQYPSPKNLSPKNPNSQNFPHHLREVMYFFLVDVSLFFFANNFRN